MICLEYIFREETMKEKSELMELKPNKGTDLTPGIPEVEITKEKPRPQWMRRWKQFWSAPVTAFLGNVVMYFTFLFLFSYVLLMDFKEPPPIGPATSEIILYFWVFTMVCEEIRQSFFVGSMPVTQKVKQYLQDSWNHVDITALLLFIVGLICRYINMETCLTLLLIENVSSCSVMQTVSTIIVYPNGTNQLQDNYLLPQMIGD